MKIGFFTDAYFPQPNGVSTSILDSVKALEKLGHEVFVVAPKYPGYKDEKNVIRLTSLKVYSKPELRVALHLPEPSLRKVLKIDFDIIHGHSGGPITLIGWEIARSKNIPYVMTYHTLWNKYTHYFLKGKVIKPKMIEQVSRIFGNRCDVVVAPTLRVKKELEMYGVKKPILVIPSGIDVERFKNVKKGFLRKKLNIEINEKILLYVGRLGKEKSVDFLLRMFEEVLKKSPATHLVFVGDGPDRKILEKIALSLKMRENVHFLGFLEPKIIPRVYADADLFVFASKTETQGLVVLEALASAVPVVAVDDPAVGLMVENGKNGLLVPEDEKIFAESVLGLLHGKEREEYSLYAKISSTKHSVEKMAKNLGDLYQDLLIKYSRESVRKIMDSDRSHEELFLVLLFFWSTIFFIRFYILSFIKESSFPVLTFFGYSIPHLFIGIFLIGLALLLRIGKKTSSFISILFFGIGAALVVDQSWAILTRGADTYSDYWSRGNLILILLFALVPVLFVKYVRRNRPQFFFGHGNNTHENPKNPRISVVVPAFNEERFLERTLISLVNQTYKNFELIVVDNNSTDKTSEIAKKYGAHVLLETKKGVAFARQKGGMYASGEIIASTDADTIVPEDWLERISLAFQDEKTVAFGGLNRLYSGPVTARSAARYLSTLFWVVDKYFSGGWNLLGSNMAVRKKTFLEVGGFNTALTLGEDVDLSQRIKKIGKIVLDTNFLVFSSGRRFRKGLLLGVLTYAPSWFMRVVFKKDKFLVFPTIRNEDSIVSKFSLAPLLLCVVFLVTVFYTANPMLTKARDIKFIEKSLNFFQGVIGK